jgi:hypothetical protein
MIEVEFEPLSQKLIDYVYKKENFEQQSFENLVVEQGRLALHAERVDREKLKRLRKHFTDSFKFITKTLVDMDVLRLPIFYDFEDWYNNNDLENKQAFGVMLDKPGFSQPFHLDNRFSMWAGSINLEDNETTTIFTTENNHWINQGLDPAEYYYKASGKKFTGTFWVNTETNWHGVPLVKTDRRVIVCNQMLAI